jgi:Mg2+ and Co2+ transporter CorA
MKKNLFRTSVFVALIAALILAAFPLTGASAAEQASTPTPPPHRQGPSNERMERTWQKMLRGYQRLGRLNDRSDELNNRADNLIAVLKVMGANTTELETALAEFRTAAEQAKPIYASCEGIIASHKGFDANGKVTDSAQALQTLADLRAKTMEIRSILEPKARALNDLWKPIRDALHPATPPASTPTP